MSRSSRKSVQMVDVLAYSVVQSAGCAGLIFFNDTRG